MLAIRKSDQPLLDAATAIFHNDRQAIYEALHQSRALARQGDLQVLAGYVRRAANRLVERGISLILRE